jgi:hypothetical protein
MSRLPSSFFFLFSLMTPKCRFYSFYGCCSNLPVCCARTLETDLRWMEEWICSSSAEWGKEERKWKWKREGGGIRFLLWWPIFNRTYVYSTRMYRLPREGGWSHTMSERKKKRRFSSDVRRRRWPNKALTFLVSLSRAAGGRRRRV